MALITMAEVTGNILVWGTISGNFVDGAGTLSTGTLSGFIDYVSEMITSYLGYDIAFSSGRVDEFFGNGRFVRYISCIPLVSIQSIIWDNSTDQATSTGVVTGYRFSQYGKVELTRGVRYSDRVWYGFDPCNKYRITYSGGRTTIPGDIKLAAMMLLQHVSNQIANDSPGSDAGSLSSWRFDKYQEMAGNSSLIYNQYAGLLAGQTDLPAPIANILRKYKLMRSV